MNAFICLEYLGFIMIILVSLCDSYRLISHSSLAVKTLKKGNMLLLNSPQKGSAGSSQIRNENWAKVRGLIPGHGGYWPGNPDAKRYNVTITTKGSKDVFTLLVPEDRYIFFYFEEEGIELPIVNKARMCRQGCCTTCCARLLSGKVKMDAPLGLLKESRDAGYILTCTSYPRSDMVIQLQDEDEAYKEQWGDGFEGGGVEWGGILPKEDD